MNEKNVNLITTTEALARFCTAAEERKFLTLDTEFMREHTFFSKLCLIQVAYPAANETDPGDAAAIDVLAPGLDLAPLITLLKKPQILKVFHAARQDLEIFYHDYGFLPRPFFDTQIAASVAGFGEQIGYQPLVKAICKKDLDKTGRFTDWSKRPLSVAQLDYAIRDVTYLRDIYCYLQDFLTKTKRMDWVRSDMEALLEPSLYEVRPNDAWLRIRTNVTKPVFLARLRALAAFRESHAVSKNVPRTRVIKDDTLLEIAAQNPTTGEDLKKIRGFARESCSRETITGLIGAIAEVEAMDPADYPKKSPHSQTPPVPESLVDLLRVLLKARAQEHKVTPAILAPSQALTLWASDPSAENVLGHGWRHEIFGKDALRLVKGEIGLSAQGKFVRIFDLKNGDAT